MLTQKGDPYKPEYWFPISTKGVKAGDAVALIGYPVASYRSWLASEMEEREQLYYPRLEELSREWVGIEERAMQSSPAAAVAVADDYQAHANRQKNAEGELAGLKRGATIEKQRIAEDKVIAWVQKHADEKPALAARDAIMGVAQERLAMWDHDFLLDAIGFGPRALRWGTTIARRATEARRPTPTASPAIRSATSPPCVNGSSATRVASTKASIVSCCSRG